MDNKLLRLVLGLALGLLAANIGDIIGGWSIEARLAAVEKDLQELETQLDFFDGMLKKMELKGEEQCGS